MNPHRNPSRKSTVAVFIQSISVILFYIFLLSKIFFFPDEHLELPYSQVLITVTLF